MNINYMLTISEYKHKTTWCFLYVLLNLLTSSVAGPQTKNEAVSEAVAMRDFFFDKGSASYIGTSDYVSINNDT
jgi:hypothetical protein